MLSLIIAHVHEVFFLWKIRGMSAEWSFKTKWQCMVHVEVTVRKTSVQQSLHMGMTKWIDVLRIVYGDCWNKVRAKTPWILLCDNLKKENVVYATPRTISSEMRCVFFLLYNHKKAFVYTLSVDGFKLLLACLWRGKRVPCHVINVVKVIPQ